jgi:hypothetical protein
MYTLTIRFADTTEESPIFETLWGVLRAVVTALRSDIVKSVEVRKI